MIHLAVSTYILFWEVDMYSQHPRSGSRLCLSTFQTRICLQNYCKFRFRLASVSTCFDIWIENRSIISSKNYQASMICGYRWNEELIYLDLQLNWSQDIQYFPKFLSLYINLYNSDWKLNENGWTGIYLI